MRETHIKKQREGEIEVMIKKKERGIKRNEKNQNKGRQGT